MRNHSNLTYNRHSEKSWARDSTKCTASLSFSHKYLLTEHDAHALCWVLGKPPTSIAALEALTQTTAESHTGTKGAWLEIEMGQQQPFSSQTMSPFVDEGVFHFTPGVLECIMSAGVVLLKLKHKRAFTGLWAGLTPSVFPQYVWPFLQWKYIVDQWLLLLDTGASHALLLCFWSQVRQQNTLWSVGLSVNRLTAIQCRTCQDMSLPLSLPSDDAVKSKSSSDADWVHDRPALWTPKAERPFAIYHSSRLSATSDFPPFQ